MRTQLAILAGTGMSLGLLFAAGSASASTTVIGNGFAASCSQSAKAVSLNRPPATEAIHVCDLAIDTEVLTTHDLAASYVNRGVLYLSMADYVAARRDFDKAVATEPGLGEAYVNRGAALIGMGREREGITEINKGIELGAAELEKAYFNRALAEERLDDLKSAYADYQKALELKPDWAMAKAELARFRVVQR
jgi:tetratricopeptide (TPR) repeat protein